jgi:hypothetical protein
MLTPATEKQSDREREDNQFSKGSTHETKSI